MHSLLVFSSYSYLVLCVGGDACLVGLNQIHSIVSVNISNYRLALLISSWFLCALVLFVRSFFCSATHSELLLRDL